MENYSRETILQEETNRYTLFPIKYHKMYKFFQDHEANFWTTEEIDLKEDLDHWKKLNENEKYFIKNVLAFFAASDGIVNENLIINFYKKVPIAEARAFYTFQMAMETIHSQTYSVLIDTFINDDREKDTLFDAIYHIPVVKKKADWAIKWMNLEEIELNEVMKRNDDKEIADFMRRKGDNKNFSRQLFAFIIVEGLFFSGSFCSIFWLKSRGLMPGLSFSNELISRDEAMHCDFGIYLYSLLNNKLDENIIHNIMREAVDIEKEFITESLPVSMIGMNCNKMKKYIEFVSDRILSDMGYSKLYNVKECPFNFMELLSFSGGNSKVNFFEKRNSDYQKSGVGRTAEDLEIGFEDDDF